MEAKSNMINMESLLYVFMYESFGYLNTLCVDKNDERKLNIFLFVFQR